MCWKAKLICCSIQLWTIEKWDHEWRDVDISRNNSWVSYRAFFFIYYWVCANAMNQWDAINGIVIFQHEHRTLLKVDLPDVTIHSLFRCWTKQRARYRYIQHWILLEYSLHSYVVQNPQATHTILTSHKRIAEMRKKYGQLMVKWHTKSRHIVAFFLQFLICISCLQSFFFNGYERIFSLMHEYFCQYHWNRKCSFHWIFVICIQIHG